MFFLFLLLEGIALSLLIRNNYVQRIAIVDTASTVTGGIYECVNNWYSYLHLKDQNQLLSEENAMLRSQLDESYYIADTTRIFNKIPTGAIRRYAYLPAKVINNSFNKQFNYLTIDRGEEQGVKIDMAVISPEGIVGIVYRTSAHFSTVIPVINRDFRISTKFKKNNFYGSLTWDGRSYKYAVLKDIPLHADVVMGDTLVVSGYSDSFPEGIMVGTVNSVEQKDGSFYNISVLLTTNFRNLYHVMVVEDMMKKEQIDLELQNPEKE